MIELETRIHREIPISAHMGVRVVTAARHRVEVSAPLAPNINHEGTVFGGSLNSLALVACWSIVTLVVDGFDVDYAVVQDSSMKFLKPAGGDFRAVSSTTDSDLEKFLNALGKHGRARIALKADVFSNGVHCASLEARFVAQRRR